MKGKGYSLSCLLYVNSRFIDDSLLCGDTKHECLQNVIATTSFMTGIGFMTNQDIFFISTQKIQYLGNIIDSEK